MAEDSSTANEWDTKASVFEHSYSEVLAALKHQDDKLNRTLTAIAFLTAAGVALYTAIGQHVDLTYDDWSANVPTVFFVGFLIFIVFALVFVLAAIGPSTPLRGKSDRNRPFTSLIYYASICRDDSWSAYIGWTPIELTRRLAENFHDEALTIAHRVEYKVARSRESGAFVQLVIISLSLLGIFSVEKFSSHTRWWIAASFLFLLLLLPLWDLFHMRLFGFPEGPPSKRNYTLLALACVWSGVLLFGGPLLEARWLALLYALSVILVSKLSLIHRKFAGKLLPAINVLGLGLVVVAIWVDR